MPIASFTSQEANANLRSDRACRWPDGRVSGARLEGVATMSIKPSFSFTTEDRVMTIGSCFAREIETALIAHGFDLPARQVEIPRHERTTQTANDILNKYTVHSMENEIRWAFTGIDHAPEDFYLRAGDDLWHDAQMVANLKPATLERLAERREMVSAMMRQLPTCRVVVVTLGLAEAWFDIKTGLYLNAMPPLPAIAAEPDRFRLDILSPDEILASLERIHGLLTEYGHPDVRMLVTVSPVPFKASFSGKDALIANTYAKSAQRAAAEIFARNHDTVDYFPSYEIVTLSDRKIAYELDNIHVTPPTVARIMAAVVKAYVPGAEIPTLPGAKSTRSPAPNTFKGLQIQAKDLMKERDYDGAVLAYTSLLFRFAKDMTPDLEAQIRLNLGVALLRLRLTEEGTVQLEMADKLDVGNARTTYKLGLGYARLGMHEKALPMFREALRLKPEEADHSWRLGAQLIRLGKVEEGVSHAARALEIDPDHAAARDLVAQYR